MAARLLLRVSRSSRLVCTQNIAQMVIPLVEKYKGALIRLSARTGTSVPSLCASFLILHEVTAIIPFIGVFYASRGLGVGEKVVDMALDGDSDVTGSQPGWARSKARQWVEEGGQFAERVGRRYGMFGYEKRSTSKSATLAEADVLPAANLGGKVAGDVANAIVAYGVVKAILPLRMGLSLYLSPPFSRMVFEPARRRFHKFRLDRVTQNPKQ